MMNSRVQNDYIRVIKFRKLGAPSYGRNLTKLEEEPTSKRSNWEPAKLFNLQDNPNDQDENTKICGRETCKKCGICLYEYSLL